MKFSEDIISLSDLKVNPGRVVRQAAREHRPVPVTSAPGGGGASSCNRFADHAAVEERAFM